MGFSKGGNGNAKPRKPSPFQEHGIGKLKENYLSGHWGTQADTTFFGCTGRDITSAKQCRKLARWLEAAADWLEYQERKK